MRDVLFRGKRIDNGEWVYGYYVQYNDERYIFPQEEVNKGIDLGGSLDCCQMHEVFPKTVGQFIGLFDKNSDKIFEGDILDREYFFERIERVIIDFDSSSFGYYSVDSKPDHRDAIDDCEWGVDIDNFKVVGNIHDNPELLKKEK